MFSIRNIFFRKKIFDAVYYKLQNFSPSLQCMVFNKVNSIPLRFCHSSSPNTSWKSKLCSAESLEKPFISGDIFSAFEKSIPLEDIIETDLILILKRFRMQCLDIHCIRKFDVRVSSDFTALLFPFSTLDMKFSAIQMMVYNKGDISQSISGLDEPVLFGRSQIKPDDKVLVVTSDPIDAIAVNQSTGVAVFSLPFSSALPNFLTDKVLTLFNTFDKVIFWMKSDLHSWKIHKFLSKNLNEKGYFIRPDAFKNPVFCLQNDFNIRQILKKANPLHVKSIETFRAYKDIIYERITKSEKVSGLKWKRFSPLNDLLKGHRRGELTVFTGHTGTGKTTFMSEYALDLCMQGLETLWISLEVSNDRLLSTMLCQFSECPLEEMLGEYDYWSNKFEDELPMFIINVQNCFSLKGIVDAMASAVHIYNVKHIVVDNLQFMMNMEDYNSMIDQLRRQDQMFTTFRNFSTRWNCHVTLVVHPRKEQEFSELTISSILGTAKTTQEADNVVILQSTRSGQYLEVSKNRYDGHKGCLLLDFDKNTYMYTIKQPKSQRKP